MAASAAKASWLAVDGALGLTPGRERASCGDGRGAGRSELMRRPPGPRRVTGTSTMCGREPPIFGCKRRKDQCQTVAGSLGEVGEVGRRRYKDKFLAVSAGTLIGRRALTLTNPEMFVACER